MAYRESGFTLLEIAIAVVILSVAIATATEVMGTTGDALGTGSTAAHLQAKAHALVHRIEQELIQASPETLSPATPNGGGTLAYRRSGGYEDGAMLWGSPLAVELVADEALNGADDDGDGYVDECRVQFVRNPGLASARATVWARNVLAYYPGEIPNGVDDNGNGVVDERGLFFWLADDVLTIGVAVQGRDAKGRPLTRTATTTIRMRN